MISPQYSMMRSSSFTSAAANMPKPLFSVYLMTCGVHVRRCSLWLRQPSPSLQTSSVHSVLTARFRHAPELHFTPSLASHMHSGASPFLYFVMGRLLMMYLFQEILVNFGTRRFSRSRILSTASLIFFGTQKSATALGHLHAPLGTTSRILSTAFPLLTTLVAARWCEASPTPLSGCVASFSPLSSVLRELSAFLALSSSSSGAGRAQLGGSTWCCV
mmetsp:Transcript_15347/g.30058  ORF Transcript_15347/g.30058 Transcript_15347/m.30058 type:complete len:217 (-) Transcript_15347:145-795(-)